MISFVIEAANQGNVFIHVLSEEAAVLVLQVDVLGIQDRTAV